MKKALLVMAAVAMGASAFAQGTIIFANRNIPITGGGTTGGGNGNGTYNVPIWDANGPTGGPNGTTPGFNGAGDLPGGVTIGLFNVGAAESAAPLATSLLRTDANSQFFATASQPVTITGSDAGTRPTLIVRAWQGAGGFAAAKNSTIAAPLQWGEWSFQTSPLGGTPPGGGLPITTPNMTGWGPETGAGLSLTVVPEPSTYALAALGIGALLLRRRK